MQRFMQSVRVTSVAYIKWVIYYDLQIAMCLALVFLDHIHCLLVAGGIDVHTYHYTAELREAECHLPAHTMTSASDLSNLMFW